MARRSWWSRPVTVMLVLLVAACGATHAGAHSSRSSSPGSYLASCGTARTAAEVPVRVEVARGHVLCATAQAVELAYAKAIRSGHAPGNGGGGPVKIMGWICQGFRTPVVLQTGKASKCTHDSNEILEILPPPPSPSASSG